MTTNECQINIFDKVPLELMIFVTYIYMFQYMYSYIFLVKNWFFFSFSMTHIMEVVLSPDPALYPGSDIWDSSFGFLIGVYDYTQIRYYCWVYPLHNVFRMFAIIEN